MHSQDKFQICREGEREQIINYTKTHVLFLRCFTELMNDRVLRVYYISSVFTFIILYIFEDKISIDIYYTLSTPFSILVQSLLQLERNL